MSASIQMPVAIDSAIKEMCADAMTQTISALAEKYGFDVEEATRHLNLDELKLARKRGPSPKKAEDKKESKKAGKKATKKDKDSGDDKPKVKRAPTGYLMFCNEHRAAVKVELEKELKEGEKYQAKDAVTKLAVMWGDADKDMCNKKSADNKKALSDASSESE